MSLSGIRSILRSAEGDEIVPMKTGKAKGWGLEYHWISLPVTEENKHRNMIPDAIEWCTEKYGKSGARWYENDRKFFFKNEKDMTLFILRYS